MKDLALLFVVLFFVGCAAEELRTVGTQKRRKSVLVMNDVFGNNMKYYRE